MRDTRFYSLTAYVGAVDLPEELASLVRRRKELGLTQEELAEKAGVSQAYISRLERGKLDPRLSTMRKIRAVLEEAPGSRGTLREVMSRPVIHASPGDTIAEAVGVMTEHGFSQLPVLRGGVPVGSVSERAVMRVMTAARDPTRLATRSLEEVMEPVPPTLPPDADPGQAVALLEDYAMVLVMAGGKVEGIVTRADILRMLERTRG